MEPMLRNIAVGPCILLRSVADVGRKMSASKCDRLLGLANHKDRNLDCARGVTGGDDKSDSFFRGHLLVTTRRRRFFHHFGDDAGRWVLLEVEAGLVDVEDTDLC